MQHLTRELADTICATRFEDLPQEVVDRTLQAIADGVAVAVAGSGEVPIRIMVEHQRELGAAAVSTVWGHGFRTSPVQAAFVNAMSAHVLDYEPMWLPPTHAVSSAVAVAFALAEARGASGSHLVAGVAKGMETHGRLQFAANQYEPEKLLFHPPGVAGTLGAAVTAAHLLQLDSHGLRNALGIAASRCGALLANVGTMTKSAHCGAAAGAGTEAALLAARGFTGNPDVLEAAKGVVQTFYANEFVPERLLQYGRPWRVVDPGLAIKLYPSQYATNFVIDAALELRSQGVDAARLRRIRITTPVMKYVDRPRPATGLEGKFSLQYAAALALLDGVVNIDSFTDQRRARDDIGRMLERIELRQTDDVPSEWTKMRVEIDAEDDSGRRWRAVSNGPSGCWGRPAVTAAEHRVKLDHCLQKGFGADAGSELLERLAQLPQASPDAVRRICRLLAQVPVDRDEKPTRNLDGNEP